MSDFPNFEDYSKPLSLSCIRRLSEAGFNKEFSIIVKREKDQYVYDIDENKYVDFYLNNGSVIVGHNYKTLTQFMKNGISTGTESAFLNKFYLKLSRLFSEILPSPFISFFNSEETALLALLKSTDAVKIGVNSSFLQGKMNTLFSGLEIEIANPAGSYDLLLFEPIDFEKDLKGVSTKGFQAKKTAFFEGRTAFRLKWGFLKNPGEADYIIGGNSIANGLSAAVVFSNHALSGENIPIFKALAVMESLKLYRRKIDYSIFGPEIKSPFIAFQSKSIFKLKRPYATNDLLPKGIVLKGDTGFTSLLHTEFDIKRLERALQC
jgi:hypothetical protein